MRLPVTHPYRGVLSDAQRAELRTQLGSGSGPARQLTRARILLKADHAYAGPGWTDMMIAGAFDVHRTTVERVRKQFVQASLAATLAHAQSDRTSPQLIDGDIDAHLIATACSTPPTGQAHWSLRLLADELIRLEVVETISHETVRQTLKKNEVKPWLVEQWCLAPPEDPAFVSQVEDVLDVYRRPYAPTHPVICLDETSRQLLGETRPGAPVAPAVAARHDPD
jgi:hypothetical protein